jgi:hypothetical protein
MLTTDILPSFEMNKQTVAAFLDISWTYLPQGHNAGRCLQRLNFLKIGSWRLVRCTPSLHDFVVKGPCGICVGIWLGLLLWNGQDSYATIGKGSVSRTKDSSGTHVFNPKQ